MIPEQIGNITVDFVISHNEAGNTATSSIDSHQVQTLLLRDLEGDVDIDIFDIVAAATHYGESW